MKKSLKKFKEKYLEHMLSFLWRQWSALGVAGYAESKDNRVIDPEALLLFSCTISRYDARLFDEILDWLTRGEFINIQRLKRILTREIFAGERVLAAIAGYLTEKSKSLKWKGFDGITNSAGEENLFLAKDGKQIAHYGDRDPSFQKHGLLRGPIKLRGRHLHFPPVETTRLLFNIKLRALLGISARAEIVAYLLTHESAHPSLIAREIYFSQKTVQDALVEMAQSGLVRVRSAGREKHYWLNRSEWLSFLGLQGNIPKWVNWPLLLSALERIWLKLNQPGFMEMGALLQSSELRILMQDIRPNIESAGFAGCLSDDRHHLGETYTDVFLSDIEKIIEVMNGTIETENKP